MQGLRTWSEAAIATKIEQSGDVERAAPARWPLLARKLMSLGKKYFFLNFTDCRKKNSWSVCRRFHQSEESLYPEHQSGEEKASICLDSTTWFSNVVDLKK